MADTEVVDEVVGPGFAKTNGQVRRAAVEETVESGTSRVVSSKSGGVVEEEDLDDNTSMRRERKMKDSTKALLAKIDAGEEDEDEDPDDEGLVEKEEKKPAPKKEAKPAPEKVVDDKKTEKEGEETEEPAEKEEVDEFKASMTKLQTDYDQLKEANRKLVDDLETAKKQPRAPKISEKLQALDEAEKMYLDDSIGAVKRMIATVLGVKTDAPEVAEELRGLYTDLTAQELQVPLEQAHKASRDAARTRQLLARDKRERQAESAKPEAEDQPEADTKQLELVTERIGQLNAPQADGSTILGEFPMLMTLAEKLDGMKPEHLLWRVLQRETKAGTIKPGTDEAMLKQAAKMIEAHYTSLAEDFDRVKTKKQNDTTKRETTKADDTASKEKSQSTGARTIKAADASVAPATTPKKAPTKESNEERPKFSSKKQAQDWALRHIPD